MHSDYVTHIGFPLQQQLHKGTSVLRYTYNTCLVTPYFLLHQSRDTFFFEG